MTRQNFYELYCEHCSQSNPGEQCIEFQVSCFCEMLNQNIEPFEPEPIEPELDKKLKVITLDNEL